MPYFKNSYVNILFIHIPKTGGTSLERYFSHKFNIPLNNYSLYTFLDEIIKKQKNIIINSSLQHITYQTILKYKTELGIDFDNIKFITIVRNPYERIISDLFFYKLITKDSSKEDVFNIIKNFLFSEKNYDNHNLPQYIFITYNDKELIRDLHILHTESLTSDMHNLGFIDFNIYENVNEQKLNYYDFLNNESINLINNFYDYDFKLFGYKKIYVDDIDENDNNII